MKFKRGSRYDNHVLSVIPLLYVCSECHGGLIHNFDGGEEEVKCIQNDEHDGFIRAEEAQRLGMDTRVLKSDTGPLETFLGKKD